MHLIIYLRKFYHPAYFPKKIKNDKYKTIVLPFALYGCETWSLILREERRLKVFENKVLRKIFGAKRHEISG